MVFVIQYHGNSYDPLVVLKYIYVFYTIGLQLSNLWVLIMGSIIGWHTWVDQGVVKEVQVWILKCIITG